MNTNKLIYSKDVAEFFMIMAQGPDETEIKSKKSFRTRSLSSTKSTTSALSRSSSTTSSKKNKKSVKKAKTAPEIIISTLEQAPIEQLPEVETVEEKRCSPMITIVSMDRPANKKFEIVDNEETRRNQAFEADLLAQKRQLAKIDFQDSRTRVRSASACNRAMATRMATLECIEGCKTVNQTYNDAADAISASA